ncbi:SDR family oxidoreductase [Gordonia sp. (in: high G+C Gram-positive bacteria)]|jgi:NAD(P)H dehydrogenase (quinone)|uniref:SDR family oxidoreductase n=1 Tax=Gordonia sp. (in: high G+C Gram-positive bacteria) TaxID=84139 RepID=UPI001D4D68DE|nr:SDR family oxidoreductase [Gordonia sp. (in: high G+C Gram-positive bacteria)]MCB1293086.1 SDR family oxidoreductase [Gordonia sp. (in: high G+C Gram-positive bacteria)]HMS74239.1 SDR family oxidoreductase [Gordonia sp. (in: high G+C Gram-positive bacteria)]
MTIAVFGATGQLGRLTIDALLARGVAADRIRALGRNPERLAELADAGVATFTIDLDDASTLAAPLQGADEVFLISGSEVGKRLPQHRAAIDAAVAAGVRRITYTSAPRADVSTLVLAPEHKATEEYLAASGLTTTILRDGWYTENYQPDFGVAQATGVIANSVGATARIASAPRTDFAEAAAIVLTTDGHDGKVYEVSGDTAWTWPEFAEAASQVLGKPIEYKAITVDEERVALAAAGLPAPVVDLVVGLNEGTRDDQLSLTTGDLSRILGRPTTPIVDTMRSWA